MHMIYLDVLLVLVYMRLSVEELRICSIYCRRESGNRLKVFFTDIKETV